MSIELTDNAVKQPEYYSAFHAIQLESGTTQIICFNLIILFSSVNNIFVHYKHLWQFKMA